MNLVFRTATLRHLLSPRLLPDLVHSHLHEVLEPAGMLFQPWRRFKKINGVLIPGGSQVLSPGHPYYDSTELLLNLTVEANDNGDFFPVSNSKAKISPTIASRASRASRIPGLIMVMTQDGWRVVLSQQSPECELVLQPVTLDDQEIATLPPCHAVHDLVQIHGTCLGFGVLLVIVSRNQSLPESFGGYSPDLTLD